MGSASVTFEIEKPDGSDFEGVEVWLEGYGEKTTDGNGEAHFEGVGEDDKTYDYEIRFEEYPQVVNGEVYLEYADSSETVEIKDWYEVTFNVDSQDGVFEDADETEVDLEGVKKNTDSGGSVTFENVANGYEYEYEIEHKFFDDYRDDTEVDGSDLTENVNIERSKHDIEVEVREDIEDEFSAIENAEIVLEREGEEITEETDWDGTVFLQDVEAGYWEYTINHKFFEDISGEIEINQFEKFYKELDTRLVFDAIILVEDEEGDPIENASVEIGEETEETDSDGQAEFEDLTAESIYVEANAEFYNLDGKDFDLVEDGQTETITLPLTEYSVTIVVEDGYHNELIEGATVEFGEDTSNTDSNGQASFTRTKGNYSYTVEKSGFEDRGGIIEVPAEGESDVEREVTMKWLRYTVEVEVLNDKTDEPIANADVSIGAQDKQTSELGMAYVHDVRYGERSYSVSHEKYYTDSGSIEVKSNQERTFRLTPQYDDVHFKIEDHNGVGVGNVDVTLSDENEFEETKGADSNGEVTFEDVEHGAYDYYVNHEDYTATDGGVFVNEETTVNVVLGREVFPVTFKVLASHIEEPEEAGVASAEVYFTGEYKETDSNGEIVFHSTPNGTYQYEITHPFYDDLTGELEVDNDSHTEEVELDVDDDTLAIQITVVDHDGEPLPNVDVKLEDQEEKVTNQDGIVYYMGLSPLEYEWQADRDGYAPEDGTVELSVPD